MDYRATETFTENRYEVFFYTEEFIFKAGSYRAQRLELNSLCHRGTTNTPASTPQV